MTGEIQWATWGAPGSPYGAIDVTELVRSLVKADGSGLVVIPSVAGVNLPPGVFGLPYGTGWNGLGDPAPGVMKELIVEFLINGTAFRRIFPENVTTDLDYGAIYASGQTTVSLPPPPPPSQPTWPNMEPDQVAGYLAWLAAGAIGQPEPWILEDRAATRQREADAAAALAIIATLPPSMQATYDLGGTGYGSAQQLVLAANPGASAGDILAQATQLQIVANAAGLLPSEVVAQQPGAAVIGTVTDPGTLTPPPGGTGTGTNIPLDPNGQPVGVGKSKIMLWLLALGAGAWILTKRKAA